MDVTVKGRHTAVPQRFRDLASDKLARIEKLDSGVMRVDVEVSTERNPRISSRRERVELTCHSRGATLRAEAAAVDRYVALDQALARLRERMRKLADRRKIHRGKSTPESVAQATGRVAAPPIQPEAPTPPEVEPVSPPDSGPAPGPAREARKAGARLAASGRVDPQEDAHEEAVLPLQGEGEATVVREKVHRANPMALEQALFEMELVGHDFFLFRDRDSGVPSVVYRRRGFDYGVIRLEE